MTDQVFIITEHKTEPNLRKLARALIALVQAEADEQPHQTHQASSESATAVIPPSGEAA